MANIFEKELTITAKIKRPKAIGIIPDEANGPQQLFYLTTMTTPRMIRLIPARIA